MLPQARATAVFTLFAMALWIAGDATAASRQASASITLYRALKVTSVSTLSFGVLRGMPKDAGTVTVSHGPPATRVASEVILLPNPVLQSPPPPILSSQATALVRTIIGEPGRAYRVQLPASATSTPGGYTVSNLVIWSDTRGDITGSKLGQLDANGKDTLRIGATLLVPAGAPTADYGADIPVTVSYE